MSIIAGRCSLRFVTGRCSIGLAASRRSAKAARAVLDFINDLPIRDGDKMPRLLVYGAGSGQSCHGIQYIVQS